MKMQLTRNIRRAAYIPGRIFPTEVNWDQRTYLTRHRSASTRKWSSAIPNSKCPEDSQASCAMRADQFGRQGNAESALHIRERKEYVGRGQRIRLSGSKQYPNTRQV